MVIFFTMGIPKESEKAILFAGLLFGSAESLIQAKEKLREQFAPFVHESAVLNWLHSHYYEDEFGPGLKRKFVLFDKIIQPEEIVEIKLATNTIEQELAMEGKRTVNIDPGYITLSKLVLATTKNYSHRIYLGKGIYAEVTLYFKDKEFHPTPFTYNDYRQQDYIEYFKMSREYLKERISQTDR